VWDLCVEEDQSFIVAGVAVANCPDYKFRWAWSNKQRGSSRVGPDSLNQAWNRAPRKTNSENKAGLCKHLLAARSYIYGLLSSFPNTNAPDTADKLNKLTRYAAKRWTDMEGQMKAAKDRDAETARRRALRNIVGRLPEPPAAPEPVEPPEEEKAPDARAAEPEERQEKTTVDLKKAKPPQLPKQGKSPTGMAAVTSPGARGRGFAPTQKPKEQKQTDPNGGYNSKAEYDFYRRQGLGDSLSFKVHNPVTENVVKENNGTHMSELTNALKLVQEMEDDMLDGGSEFDMGAPAPETGPSMDMGMDPSEPPVSDSAIGADSEGDTALGLLRQMKDLLTQIAGGMAPPEGEPGHEESETPDEEAAEQALGEMPPEPPKDDEVPEEGEKDEPQKEDDEDDKFKNRRPGK
jgi:hypothetical protein